ncbi:MAG: MotA/TolQ/ExbB proton channel family protein [Verrucomicrobia bacterium]|nr:MotA/TolQ/ExbB proton channel family protein [Verrucomicrobiota bacterium]
MFEYFDKGGPMMWLIVVASVFAIGIFFERLFHLHRAQIKTSDFMEGIYTILNRRNVAEAVGMCQETPGPVARIISAGILHHDESQERIEQAMEQAGLEEIPRLERNIGLLATIAQVAPLMGLLGTVLGMIKALMMIEQKAPLVHAGDLAGAMWQALLSTAAGLFVAITVYAAYNFLIGRIEGIILDMERCSAQMLSFLTARQSSFRTGTK